MPPRDRPGGAQRHWKSFSAFTAGRRATVFLQLYAGASTSSSPFDTSDVINTAAASASSASPRWSLVVDEDESFVSVYPHFLQNKEVALLGRLAKKMGFHHSAKLEEPAKVTFLPSDGKPFSYEGPEGEVDFDPSDVLVDEESVALLEKIASQSASAFTHHLGAKWNRTAVSLPRLKVFRPLTRKEDAHLDNHLDPHVVGTTLLALEGSSFAKKKMLGTERGGKKTDPMADPGDISYEVEDDELEQEGGQGADSDLQESTSSLGRKQKSSVTLIFPCVETEDFEAKEWNLRRKTCETAYHTLNGAHGKLLSRLQYGINHESEATRMQYLEDHPELSVFHSVFTEEEASGLRKWNWQWTESEEKTLKEHMNRDGLGVVVADMCAKTGAAGGGKNIREESYPGSSKGLAIELTPGMGVSFLSQRVASLKRDPVVERMGWHAICAPGKKAPMLGELKFVARPHVLAEWKKIPRISKAKLHEDDEDDEFWE